jgi:hypothetical protein
MIKRKDYFEIKHSIKSMCKDNALELCEKVGLSDYETKLISHMNKDSTRVRIAMDLGVCESKISKDNKKVITKINDYLKRQH